MIPYTPVDIRAERVRLGHSAVEVSRLCLGLGSSGFGHDSLQARQPCHVVAEYLLAALEHGVTWWDTADNYGSHPHVRAALSAVPRERVQITSKTYAHTADDAEQSVARMLDELGVTYVDLVLLHEVDTVERLQASRPALEALARLRDQGLVRAVGLSTHTIDVLERLPGDSAVEIVLTNYNFRGVHMDADRADYERVLQQCFASGQGVCAMKTLGEGVLRDCAHESLLHNLSQDWIHGVLVGVTSLAETLAATRTWHEVLCPPPPPGTHVEA